MTLSRRTRIALGLVVLVVMAFVYIPLFVVVASSFNTSKTFTWPLEGFTTYWWTQVLDSPGFKEALATSVEVGIAATAIALLLGTLLSFAVGRYSWFGRDAVSFLVVLPIALPGIVTGVALQNAFVNFHPFGIGLGLAAVIIGHSTFCIVVVYNNVVARLRRSSASFEEASMDLGATTFQTFRHITFPATRSALVAGALLAFGLSFDEIIVTQFTAGAGVQTLPIWIFQNLARPNQAPVVNVVAAILILVAIIPVWLTNRLAGDAAGGGRL
jgi:putative spermidine/putrescine transport system permease protein